MSSREYAINETALYLMKKVGCEEKEAKEVARYTYIMIKDKYNILPDDKIVEVGKDVANFYSWLCEAITLRLLLINYIENRSVFENPENFIKKILSGEIEIDRSTRYIALELLGKQIDKSANEVIRKYIQEESRKNRFSFKRVKRFLRLE